ncbi:hypothetical protein [Myceligenerans pegani]|uniref:Uncharacterized protein n=1 Tax=Myceligenerans pegani TaxID=2776917 RepID=A0ABR9MW36_9MICO|nr:hypothetical protein [Myceligenerans sp. TRM 65318]MBE1875335.1 hypothetical protein [Myceligenerans sp. TRM 65318]MBE3017606.1 hypothetical protein [Myceligenerans sp. TRM 65318]
MNPRRAVPARATHPRWAPRLLLGVGLAGVLGLGACAGPAAPGSGGTEPSGNATAGNEPDTAPPAIPAAPGPVTVVTTVLQKGDGPPELCLGGVAESLPPQCGGPEVAGWDWDAVESDSAQDTTWGEYEVEGTWDGETFHLTSAAAPPDEWPELPEDPRLDPDNPGAAGPDTPEGDAHDLQVEVYQHLDGLSGWTENGYVWVTVVYDDGRIQRYADATFGADTVAVLSALRDVE